MQASAAYPENTLASFEAAIRDGAEGIESGESTLSRCFEQHAFGFLFVRADWIARNRESLFWGAGPAIRGRLLVLRLASARDDVRGPAPTHVTSVLERSIY